MFRLIFVILFSFNLYSQCKSSNRFAEQLASAGMFANLRNKPGSIRFETSRLLSEAQSSQKINEIIKYQAIPNKFLVNYSEQQDCLAQENKTKINPISYENIKLKNSEEFSELISNLSQGKGDLGKDLYEKCTGSCSPQYSAEIKSQLSGLLVNLKIICGSARDKDDNNYQITVDLLSACG